MRHPLACLAAAVALTLTLPMASATVLNFDTLKGGPTAMPASFGGLDWFGWEYYSTDQGNQPYAPFSGETRLLTNLGDGNEISSANAFTFQGAAFTGYATEQLSYQLKLGGAVVHTSDAFQVGTVPTFVASGYDGAVDQVVVLNNAKQRFVMDNLTFNEVPLASPVPELATWPLMGIGLAMLLALRRRRDTRKA